MSINLLSNRSPKAELTTEQRACILAAVDAGLSKPEIARRYNVARQTVYNTIKRYSTTYSLESQSRSGRPNKLSARDRRRILRIVRKQPKIAYALLQDTSDISVSKSTFYRVIKAAGIIN